MSAQTIGLHGFLLLAGAILAPTAEAQSKSFRAGPVYANEATCAQSSHLRPEQCRNAFANAKAELSDTAPRFRSRQECEISFRRCSIVSFTSLKDATLQPTLEGVQIVSAAGGIRVIPVIAGKRQITTFLPRTVDALWI